ncbi:uncharacterized protein LOC121371685 [Gigantopelta aegis]|uniref:uncharacterized protein LOC121371685 n=1 Tax=Gigantopelta aegis TaxID=1735272 RepID=UPI001B88839C|nr:uncharacterized protein LOC121371685 [Gigantopelta aegis]
MKLKREGSSRTNLSESKQIWVINAKERFNVLCVGTVFRQSGLTVVVGGEDGVIRIYELSASGTPVSGGPQLTLETKSGPVQTMTIHDITKFYHKDLIVGDSKGILTIFCNQQILSRQSVSGNSINCLQVSHDSVGSISIITSNDSGVISAVLPSCDLWRINLNNTQLRRSPALSVNVQCLLTTNLTDQSGKTCNYVIAADDTQHIHVILQGSIVMTMKVPAVVTAMTQGKFVPASKVGSTPQVNENVSFKDGQQVALGTATGAVYILYNFAVTLDEFTHAQCPVTRLATVPQPDANTDILACAGHFNAVTFYQDGKAISSYTTDDWVNTIDVADLDNDGVQEVIIGCLDNSIHAVKILT